MVTFWKGHRGGVTGGLLPESIPLKRGHAPGLVPKAGEVVLKSSSTSVRSITVGPKSTDGPLLHTSGLSPATLSQPIRSSLLK